MSFAVVIPPYSATCMFSLVLHCHDLYLPPHVLVVIDPCSRVFLPSCLDKVSLHAFRKMHRRCSTSSIRWIV